MRHAPPAWLAILLLAAPRGGPALEIPHVEAVWPDPGLVEDRQPAPALLSLPVGWSVGDAAVLLLADGQRGAMLRARLRDGLLAEGAAVLETAAPLAGEDCVQVARRRMSAFSAVLHQRVGAGMSVVVGFGCTGGVALAAAAEARRRADMAKAPTLAAGIAVDGSEARFARGAPPAQEEDWPMRARLLCAALGRALAPDAGTGSMAACLFALLPLRAEARRE